MSECLFCKMVDKKIPVNLVYEDDDTLAFRDINPVAPVHILLIPKKHAENILEIDGQTAAALQSATKKIVAQEALDKGFRLVANTGSLGGQTVFHLHWHIISGRHMGWPPG